MSFLQPLILFGLPLIGLPILIHLINYHRHHTVHWGAMLFLNKARRMTTGVSRLRFLLILLMRMLVIAGLVLAISRPLASGWLGLTAGGATDTAIILLDRSASMEERNLLTNRSKRETAIERLDDFLQKVGRNTKVVLIENTRDQPVELESPDQLPELPQIGSSATAADIPAMLESALNYIAANQTGRTDIWVCSDLRNQDWDPDSGRWDAIRSEFARREAVRFYLLNFPETSDANLGLRIENVRRRDLSAGAELVMDLHVFRSGSDATPRDVPLQFVINGARSTVNISLTGSDYQRRGFTIPLDQAAVRGSGRVELPDDTNPQDYVFHFAFAEPPARKTVVVSDDPDVADVLRLAAGTAADTSFSYDVDIIRPSRVQEINWDDTAMLLWHSSLPKGQQATQVQQFVDLGRTVFFFPPEKLSGASLFGAEWTQWESSGDGQTGAEIATWRSDIDLTRNTDNGSPLPIGKLRAYRFCTMQSEQHSVLAQLTGDQPLLSRAITDRGSVYFCSTLPTSDYSSFENDGVILYVLIQRALNQALGSLGVAQLADAGSALPDLDSWSEPKDAASSVLLSDRRNQVGIYQKEERLLAINRPRSEDDDATVTDESLQRLFSGLAYTQIRDDAGSDKSLTSEIWRTFLVAMILALFVEAFLCLPERNDSATSKAHTVSP